jgi:hypothetical protein
MDSDKKLPLYIYNSISKDILYKRMSVLLNDSNNLTLVTGL